uniref:NADH-ubiquinone oxidoreductase chain 2 n=1 Tax=Amblyomma triguttatum TaxID=65637 RepID=Q6I7N2_9ACAR|nr:NADH dehydrogenase subunit 2 [Amblyomma triguttatum]BAD24951.1 NADH dehydrogenase subunit 2 [Amblyomma triguttatum]
MNFNILMKWLILMTIMISMSVNSWFIFWMMMEMNLMFFIPILNKQKMTNSNSMITYFVIQSFSSTIFIMMAILNFITYFYMFKILMIISIMIKLAIIPFHFWLISISEMIEFNSLFFILSLQKFIPLFILSKFNSQFMIMFALASAILGSLSAMNSKMLKKMLIFSSISHQGWMIMLIMMKSNFWISYLLIYSIMIYKVTSLMKMFKFNYISEFFNYNKNSLSKISLIMMMMSLSGMPPFMGFTLKIISIIILLTYFNFSIIILILSSMLNIYFYLNSIQSFFLLNLIKFKKMIMKTYMFKNMILNFNIFMIIFLFNLMIF